jgi:SnoaL-like protein
MSRENVEIVRRFLEAYKAEDAREIAAYVGAIWDADGDYYPARKFLEQPCHGRDEIAAFHARYLDAWDQLELSIEQLIPVGDDRVLACVTMVGEGRQSGLRLDGPLYQCCWLRHGRFFRMEDHLTLSGALRALGLTGETLEAVGLRE